MRAFVAIRCSSQWPMGCWPTPFASLALYVRELSAFRRVAALGKKGEIVCAQTETLPEVPGLELIIRLAPSFPRPPPPPASPPSQSWPVSTSRNPLAQRWFRPLVSTVLLHTSTSLALNYIEGKDYYCSGTRAIRYSTLLKPVSFTTTSISSEDRNVFIVDWT
jgi:hypothetical protein